MLTKQEQQALKDIEKDCREKTKQADILNRLTLKYKTKNRYYCQSCEEIFWSKLEVKNAICTKCGSDRIMSM